MSHMNNVNEIVEFRNSHVLSVLGLDRINTIEIENFDPSTGTSLNYPKESW